MQTDNGIIAGWIVKPFEFSHENIGIKFYSTMLRVKRNTEVFDDIKIVVPEKLIKSVDVHVGNFIQVSGKIRSLCSKKTEYRAITFFFAQDLINVEPGTFANNVCFDCEIHKVTNVRLTPNSKKVVDVQVKIDRPNSTDYVWCTFWGLRSIYISSMNVGEKIRVSGRLTSRTFTQNINGQNVETYRLEVSVSDFEEI